MTCYACAVAVRHHQTWAQSDARARADWMASGKSEVPQCSEHLYFCELILVLVLDIELNGPQTFYNPLTSTKPKLRGSSSS